MKVLGAYRGTNTFSMSLHPLLLLPLLLCGSLASHFYGTVMTFYSSSNPDGSVRLVLRYKLSAHNCREFDTWKCFDGTCGNLTAEPKVVDLENNAEWCQREGIITQRSRNASEFQLQLNDGAWIADIVNGVRRSRALTLVDLRNRSDTGQANRSPQTTVLPALLVPSNCRRDFDLLAFDPDGDEVKCRYGNKTEECNPCTPPSVLVVSTSCTLSFNATNSTRGPYAVQLVMEDFPRQNITLVQTSGSVETKTTSDPLSKLPVQFVLRVEDTVPSCTEGHYLPKFLPPTPANRARLYAHVNQTLEILIKAEAINSTVSELLFSGPHSVTKNASGAGQFSLSWTPSEEEEGQNHPICFVVQAVMNSFKYHSELRCVIVSVASEPATTALPPTSTRSPGPGNVLGLKVRLSSDAPLTDADIRNAVTQQLKEELVRRGLPPDIALQVITISRQ